MECLKEWPELVGKTGEEAKEVIAASAPEVKDIIIVPQDSMVTGDFRTDRVWIFVDGAGIVVKTPRIG